MRRAEKGNISFFIVRVDSECSCVHNLTPISHGLLLQDICFLTNGDPPAWLPSSLEMELSLGLELLEAVLRGYPRVFVKVWNTSIGTMGVVDSHTHSNTYCET